MELLIVTGMSGAGKTQAANALEDMGYYCVDNIPPSIIPSFTELRLEGKLAIVTDARGGNMFFEIMTVLKELRQKSVDYKILFLDASDEVLIRRYKENRRRHPIAADDMPIGEAVTKERGLLDTVRQSADYVIDTSYISVSQLKVKLSGMFFGNVSNALKIECKSFGFKYGTDTEADIVIDVRCLPNPYYVEELKNKTGLEQKVRDYVMGSEESVEFYNKLISFLDCSVPLYVKEGKSRLTLAFGCTGGKHRSVTFAELTGSHLKEQGYDCNIIHRDIQKR